MGTVSNRGTKDRPLWARRYVDADGKRKQRPTKQPTKALAQRFVAAMEPGWLAESGASRNARPIEKP